MGSYNYYIKLTKLVTTSILSIWHINIFSRIQNINLKCGVIGVACFAEGEGAEEPLRVWRVQPASCRLARSEPSTLLTHMTVESQASPLPGPFKVSYTSESSLFIIAQLNLFWMSERAAKMPHWIRTHQEQQLIILWLIVWFSCLFCRWQPVIILAHSQR